MATSSYAHRIDSDLRAQSEAIYSALGTAINVCLKKSVAVGGFPFDVRLDAPTKETVEAMLEAENVAKDPQVKALSVDEALEELKR